MMNQTFAIKTCLFLGLLTLSTSCGDVGYVPSESKFSTVPNPSPTPGSEPQSGSNRRILKSISTRECIPKNTFGNIYFDCTMPVRRSETIRNDLQILRQMNLGGESALKLQQMLHISVLTGDSLFDWLQQRVKFILDETFENQNGGVLARNLSIPLFSVYRNPTALVEVPGFGQVDIDDQHVGIILLGKSFFDDQYREGWGVEYFRSVVRLSTLIHEARHSDGRDSSLGFLHSVCPEGNLNVGLYACDSCSNGSYAIQNLFLQSVRQGCVHCTDLEKDFMKIQEQSFQLKVLSQAKECDDRVEK